MHPRSSNFPEYAWSLGINIKEQLIIRVFNRTAKIIAIFGIQKEDMKKILVLAGFAFLVSGLAFANDGDKGKTKTKKTVNKTCGKECSKKKAVSKP